MDIIDILKSMDNSEKTQALYEKRYQANKRIAEMLTNLIEKNHELRFSQILHAFHFVRNQQNGGWENEFYLESEKLLERIEEYYDKDYYDNNNKG